MTLAEAELCQIGLTHLGDLAEISMTKFQGRYFRFMLPTFSGAQAGVSDRREAIDRWWARQRINKFTGTGVLGLQRMDEALNKRRSSLRRKCAPDFRAKGMKMTPSVRAGRGNTKSFVAYNGLNDVVRLALRNLGKRIKTQLRD